MKKPQPNVKSSAKKTPRILYQFPPAEAAIKQAEELVKEIRQERQRKYHETGTAEITAYRELEKAIQRGARIWHHPVMTDIANAALIYNLARSAMMKCEAEYCGIGVRRRDELIIDAEQAVISHNSQRATGHSVGNIKATQQELEHGGTVEELRPRIEIKFKLFAKTELRPLKHACEVVTKEDAIEKRTLAKNHLGKLTFTTISERIL